MREYVLCVTNPLVTLDDIKAAIVAARLPVSVDDESPRTRTLRLSFRGEETYWRLADLADQYEALLCPAYAQNTATAHAAAK